MSATSVRGPGAATGLSFRKTIRCSTQITFAGIDAASPEGRGVHGIPPFGVLEGSASAMLVAGIQIDRDSVALLIVLLRGEYYFKAANMLKAAALALTPH
jgi:hypothetical protein